MSAPSTLHDWADGAAAPARLEAAGLGFQAAGAKADLFRLCAESLLADGLAATAPAEAIFVPGRIEILGKHTDYAGGRSILAAVDHGFCLLAVPGEPAQVRMTDARTGECCRFQLTPDLAVPGGTWFNYPMTVGRRLARNFPDPPLRGASIAFASDLPPASGMSSSSALMVATALALARGCDLPSRPAWRESIRSAEDLAEYLGCVENGQTYRGLAGDRGVGTFGGSEDHTAMLCCRQGFLSQYSYCPLRFERSIAMPAGTLLAVASSGVTAEKTGSAMAKYNRASRLAAAVAEEWRKATGRADPHIADALRSGPRAAQDLRGILGRASGGEWPAEELRRRFEHFQAESEEIIPAAGEALARGDLAEFGRQVDRSQDLAESLLGNQVPETILLARSARHLGAAAASAFGAGFGGSVWALVPSDQADEFLVPWRAAYSREFPNRAGRAEFFLTEAGAGTKTISDMGFRIAD